jgi:hypothetical protein
MCSSKQIKELAECNAVYEFEKTVNMYGKEYIRYYYNKLAELNGSINSTCNCQHNSNPRENEPCYTFDCRTAKINKARVNSLEIIARMLDDKPYYELKYRQVGKKDYSIGYSSYDLKTVLGYIDEYFEIVESDKQTNADRIRNMSDEELASVLFSGCIDSMDLEECPYVSESELDNNKIRKVCKKCTLEWLQSESE